MSRRIKCLILIFIVISSNTWLYYSLLFSNSSSNQFILDDSEIENINIDELENSNGNDENVIIFFSTPSFNNTVKQNFTNYGGIINKEWNNTFNSVSGFSGTIPSENISVYQSNWPDATVETDEIIETQMNYATIQTGAINASWSVYGYNGDTNSSIAVLDTGVNPYHEFFPNGYDETNLGGDIVGWQDFINEGPISDDNGHGTFISSVITGTGKESYNSSSPTTVKLYGNYSHLDLYDEYVPSGNYSFKIFSFNASKIDSKIVVDSSWDWQQSGIDGFWVELFNDTNLANASKNTNTNTVYTINHSVADTGDGIYDVYITYHKQLNTVPIFSFNVNVTFFPEFYVENYSYFTGVANASKIVSYKIVNKTGIGYTSDLIDAMLSVIQNRTKYQIISVCLSVGTLGNDVEAINSVIDEVIESGILVVIAAGNDGITGSDPLNKLALNKNAIVVGAINDKDQITSYSSMGKDIGDGLLKPDIVAPGGSKLPGHRSIISADFNSNKTTGAYGTSIATAIVSAAINILIEAKCSDWTQWNNLNLTNWVKTIKAILLMTASETVQDREDDPDTDTIDESDYSPTRYLDTLTTGLKDIHEGYGRLNIQPAVDALTKYVSANSTINGSLISSNLDPLGDHVFARRINLSVDQQYTFNLTIDDLLADFDMYLFSNQSNLFGEPILLASSRRVFADLNTFFFTPKENQTECILVIKAINGNSTFNVNITWIENIYEPELKVPEITYVGGQMNTTVISYQIFVGNNPGKNYTIDQYYFFIDYFDNDTSNVPPQEIYVCIDGTMNYSLTQFNPADVNYTNGALFWSAPISLHQAKTYQYYFVASDGKYTVKSSTYSIIIEAPTDAEKIPYIHNFFTMGGWTTNEPDYWAIMPQNNLNDNRQRVYETNIYPIPDWYTMYFGLYHNLYQNIFFPLTYSYQPPTPAGIYPNGSLTSPLFDLTNLSEYTNPLAKFLMRISVNSLDFIYLQISVNWSGWTTLETYTNEEREWFMETINLTQYKGSYIQFRIETAINGLFDPIKNRGFMIDYFEIENYTNTVAPEIFCFPLTSYVEPTGSKFDIFTFSCQYYDVENNYPEFVYLQIGGKNYSMYNLQGDWRANYTSALENGILFSIDITLGDISDRKFKFWVSDGKHVVDSPNTDWWNDDGSYFTFTNPATLDYNEYRNGVALGYNFSNTALDEYYIAGTPSPNYATAWLAGDNTWHSINLLGQDMLYGGQGTVSYGAGNLGYGTNWNANLITKPVHIRDDHNEYLFFTFNISLEIEFFIPNPDTCRLSISTDYGNSWEVLQEWQYQDYGDFFIAGSEKILLSKYADEDIMVMFTLYSNDISPGVAYGWFLYDLFIGYDANTDFVEPTIEILNPSNAETVSSTIKIKAKLEDNKGIDKNRIQIYINDQSVDKEDIKFDENTGIMEYKWDTTQLDDAGYEIKIVAFDNEGNRVEDSVTVVIDNGVVDWDKWAPFVIILLVAVLIALILFLATENRGKAWFKKLSDQRVEKIRLKNIDKDQIRKRIEIVSRKEELERPLTLHCKFCNSWFSSDTFDIICPVCDHDQIYAAYNCMNCGKWYNFSVPNENYYCKKCTPVDKQKRERRTQIVKKKVQDRASGVRLIRLPREEVENILAETGKILREFESKEKRDIGILDL